MQNLRNFQDFYQDFHPGALSLRERHCRALFGEFRQEYVKWGGREDLDRILERIDRFPYLPEIREEARKFVPKDWSGMILGFRTLHVADLPAESGIPVPDTGQTSFWENRLEEIRGWESGLLWRMVPRRNENPQTPQKSQDPKREFFWLYLSRRDLPGMAVLELDFPGGDVSAMALDLDGFEMQAVKIAG